MTQDASAKPVRDASTIIVLREAEGGLETFMLCRHGQSGFMGGAHVFPGGKIDSADGDAWWQDRIDRKPGELADLLHEEDPAGAIGLWVGGIRETFEEAGVLLADHAPKLDLKEARTHLGDGADFLRLAQQIDLRIQASALTPYARWITPKMESKRYDTRFFIATLPGEQEASHDGTETTSAVWLRPADALEAMRGGRIKLAPPTVRTLDWLQGFGDIASAIADASSRPPPLVRPRLITGESSWFLALPGDPEHPERDPVLPGSTRMVLEGTAWVDAQVPVG